MWNILRVYFFLHNIKMFNLLYVYFNKNLFFKKYIFDTNIFLTLKYKTYISSRCIIIIKNTLKKYILHFRIAIFFDILSADVVTPLSRNLPGAFMALLWSSAWRRLIKPISRVLCKLSVPWVSYGKRSLQHKYVLSSTSDPYIYINNIRVVIWNYCFLSLV